MLLLHGARRWQYMQDGGGDDGTCGGGQGKLKIGGVIA